MSFLIDIKASSKVAPESLDTSADPSLSNMDGIDHSALKPAILINDQHQKTDRIKNEKSAVSRSSSYEAEEAWLWLKDTELNDQQRPLSPSIPAKKTTNVKKMDFSSSPNYMIKHSTAELVRDSIHEQAEQGDGKFKLVEVDIREGDPFSSSPPHGSWHRLSEGREDYERGRKLSKVVEESESFCKREFGSDVLIYMSTHNSASHALNFKNHGSLYDYRNQSPASHHTSSYQVSNNLIGSKSAPASGHVASAYLFANLRRGRSDASQMRTAMPQHQYVKRRKPRTLISMLMWPLLKVRDGYVGCMMGLEGTGDLTGMAQGSNYGSAGQYFANVPLSKTDSRNYG